MSEQIEQKHLNLVRTLVRMMVPVHLHDDAFQEGCVGLIDASRKYRSDQHASFTTYAGIRIRGAILDYLREQDTVSRGDRTMIKAIEHAELAAQNAAQPADDQHLAETVGISLERLQQYRQLAADVSGGPEELTMADKSEERLPSTTGDAFAEVARAETASIVRRAIAQLPERERRAMTLYYLHALTMAEAADVLGVTESRVSQLHTQAVSRLRELLRSAELPVSIAGPDLVDEFANQAVRDQEPDAVQSTCESGVINVRRPIVRHCKRTDCGIEFSWQPPPIGGRVPSYCEQHRYVKHRGSPRPTPQRVVRVGYEERRPGTHAVEVQVPAEEPQQLPQVVLPYLPPVPTANDYAVVLADMEAKRDALNEAIESLRKVAQLVGLPPPVAAPRAMGAAA